MRKQRDILAILAILIIIAVGTRTYHASAPSPAVSTLAIPDGINYIFNDHKRGVYYSFQLGQGLANPIKCVAFYGSPKGKNRVRLPVTTLSDYDVVELQRGIDEARFAELPCMGDIFGSDYGVLTVVRDHRERRVTFKFPSPPQYGPLEELLLNPKLAPGRFYLQLKSEYERLYP